MQVVRYAGTLLQSGAGSLAAYLAAHVLLCLMPAFFIAGGLTALMPKEAVTKYLGKDAPKFVSYPAAALGGFVLAVCSCTILPLFAGIYRKGAGLGPAITFLFVGPAINILALSYTGVALGMDIAIARLVLSIIFGIGIGLTMAIIYSRRKTAIEDAPPTFSGDARVEGRVWLFLGLLLALLIVGTLQVGLLTQGYVDLSLPISRTDALQETLNRWIPFDASRGEEGVTVQGLALILMLATIAVTAWRGLGHVDEGYNGWTWAALGLIALTLTIASMRIIPGTGTATLTLTGRTFGVILLMTALWYVARRYFHEYDMQEFLWETWRFVKQIFPLLLVGVFAVGVIRQFIRPEWIQTLAGRNTALANLAGVVFGVFMYFPTLVEVPIANMFLSLGMHRGPLLAYLMADPELSLQSILITAKVIGRARAWAYVALVALFSTLAGLLYGAWVDGASVWAILACLAVGVTVLALGLSLLKWRRERVAVATSAGRQV